MIVVTCNKQNFAPLELCKFCGQNEIKRLLLQFPYFRKFEEFHLKNLWRCNFGGHSALASFTQKSFEKKLGSCINLVKIMKVEILLNVYGILLLLFLFLINLFILFGVLLLYKSGNSCLIQTGNLKTMCVHMKNLQRCV